MIGEKREIKDIRVVPGVGQYDIDDSVLRPSNTTAIISPPKRSTTPVTDMSPGPGAYGNDTDEKAPIPHWFTIGERRKGPRKMNVPGPGTYEQNLHSVRGSTPMYSIAPDNDVYLSPTVHISSAATSRDMGRPKTFKYNNS